MARKKEKKRGKKRRSTFRVILSYIFLWPTLRNYFLIWYKYFKRRDKSKKKEKIVIIED